MYVLSFFPAHFLFGPLLQTFTVCLFSCQDFQPLGPEEFREVTDIVTSDKKNLKRMGLLTGLAIALHNFPEGLATFVATLSSPALGGALALAIALHNIPEGVCVSMPVYYATGSKVKAFLWAFLSGVSEPLGMSSMIVVSTCTPPCACTMYLFSSDFLLLLHVQFFLLLSSFFSFSFFNSVYIPPHSPSPQLLF